MFPVIGLSHSWHHFRSSKLAQVVCGQSEFRIFNFASTDNGKYCIATSNWLQHIASWALALASQNGVTGEDSP